MSQQWNDFAISATSDELPTRVTPGNYVKTRYSAHYLMVAWVAGPERAFRVPGSFENKVVRINKPDPVTREPVISHVPYTAEDQQDIDRGINHGLNLVNIPELPSLFDWYVRVPKRIKTTKELENAFLAKNREDTDAAVLRRIEQIYSQLSNED